MCYNTLRMPNGTEMQFSSFKEKTDWEVSLKGKLKDINTAHIHRNNFKVIMKLEK